MRVIEQLLEAKTGNLDDCEDGIFVSEQFVAVVDGATSKAPTLWDGKKSGRVARDLVLESLESLPRIASASECMAHLDAGISNWYASKNITDQMQKNPIERPSASAPDSTTRL